MWGDEGQRRHMLPLRVVTAALGVHGEWEAAMELTVETLHGAMDVWATRGLWVPEVGYELAGRAGRVLAEAERAWPGQQVAVLHGK